MTGTYFDSSVIIPVHNREKLIVDTINSIKMQSTPFREIIVVDDGSTDKTEMMIKKYFSDVIYIKTPNRGVQNARNTGASHAKSEWLTFCDSDDMLNCEFSSCFNRFLQDSPEIDIAYSNFCFLLSTGLTKSTLDKLPKDFLSGSIKQENFYKKIPDLLQKILFNQFLWPTGLTIRSSAFNSLGGYDTKFRNVRSEDLEFTLRALSQLSLAVSIVPLVTIRKHEDNLSADSSRQLQGEVTILKYFISSHPYGILNSDILNSSIQNRLHSLVINAYQSKDFDLTQNTLNRFSISQHTFKSYIKFLICILPEPIRSFLWRISVF